MKITFQLVFEIYKDKEKLEHLTKDANNFPNERNETFKFEEKTLEIDDFNNVEEKEFENCKGENNNNEKKDSKQLKKRIAKTKKKKN